MKTTSKQQMVEAERARAIAMKEANLEKAIEKLKEQQKAKKK